jgi:hypothetical protein
MPAFLHSLSEAARALTIKVGHTDTASHSLIAAVGFRSVNDVMDQPPNIIAARRFVGLVTDCESPSVQMLSRRLDELALSYHDTPDGDPDESDERPSPEGRVEYADIGPRFPTLGYYGSANPREVVGEALVGDAIDDIMDITNDLKEVLWRFERFGADDAHWHFRFLYVIHWGEHLRDLARYLHSRLMPDGEEAVE